MLVPARRSASRAGYRAQIGRAARRHTTNECMTVTPAGARPVTLRPVDGTGLAIAIRPKCEFFQGKLRNFRKEKFAVSGNGRCAIARWRLGRPGKWGGWHSRAPAAAARRMVAEGETQ